MTLYPDYKPSGIDWIGDIPQHWEVKKLKYVVTKIDEEIEQTDFLIAVENIQGGTGKLIGMEEDKPYQGSVSAFRTGDVIFNKLRPYLAKVYHAEKDGGCFGELLVLRGCEELDQNFLFYRTISQPFIAVVNSSTEGTKMPRANWDDLIKQLPIPLPPLTEQTAIARYLDEKTTQLDTLIARKRRLIDLLREEKVALINEAVTKGINPGVPMKDSGIEWLGEVPAHWEVKKLKYVVTKVGSGVTPSGGAAVYKTEGIPLLRSQNIHFDGLRLDDVAYIEESVDESMKNSRTQHGDVLLNITGASIGRCYFVPEDLERSNVNQHVCIVRPRFSTITTHFLYLLLRSSVGQTQIDLLQTGANREGLNFEQLKNFTLPLPDLSEQTEIVAYLDTETTKIDYTLSRIEREIELMQEYRTALISEVVTGKVCVV